MKHTAALQQLFQQLLLPFGETNGLPALVFAAFLRLLFLFSPAHMFLHLFCKPPGKGRLKGIIQPVISGQVTDKFHPYIGVLKTFKYPLLLQPLSDKVIFITNGKEPVPVMDRRTRIVHPVTVSGYGQIIQPLCMCHQQKPEAIVLISSSRCFIVTDKTCLKQLSGKDTGPCGHIKLKQLLLPGRTMRPAIGIF